MSGKIHIVTSEFITLPRYNKAPPPHLNPLAAKFVHVRRLLKLFNSLFVSLHINNNVTPHRRALNPPRNGINPLREINNDFFFSLRLAFSFLCVSLLVLRRYIFRAPLRNLSWPGTWLSVLLRLKLQAQLLASSGTGLPGSSYKAESVMRRGLCF